MEFIAKHDGAGYNCEINDFSYCCLTIKFFIPGPLMKKCNIFVKAIMKAWDIHRHVEYQILQMVTDRLGSLDLARMVMDYCGNGHMGDRLIPLEDFGFPFPACVPLKRLCYLPKCVSI